MDVLRRIEQALTRPERCSECRRELRRVPAWHRARTGLRCASCRTEFRWEPWGEAPVSFE